jgi:Zn-dependent peptidase ImmA (M78 family)
MTWDPWRGDEEYTLVHELIHILLYKYDKYSENNIKKYLKNSKILDKYFDNLEKVVHALTKIILGRN